MPIFSLKHLTDTNILRRDFKNNHHFDFEVNIITASSLSSCSSFSFSLVKQSPKKDFLTQKQCKMAKTTSDNYQRSLQNIPIFDLRKENSDLSTDIEKGSRFDPDNDDTTPAPRTSSELCARFTDLIFAKFQRTGSLMFYSRSL